MDSPLKIYPTTDECRIKNKVLCPLKDCGEQFTSESNLNLHIIKTHKRSALKSPTIEKQYFCPQIDCPWSRVKSFKNMKSLRQHYLKVHTEKNFTCSSCQKSFVTESVMLNHVDFCNVIFKCMDCKASYDCYDTLKTHSRRKNHTIFEKTQYRICNGATSSNSIVVFTPANERLLLPRPAPKLQQDSGKNKPSTKSKMSQVQRFDDMSVSHSTQETQTNWKNSVFSVETQTNGEFVFVKPKNTTEENFKHINTQTDTVQSKETSCNTSFDLEDFEFTFNDHIEKNSSSTQTCTHNQDIFNISTATHDSIHTDTSDLLVDSLGAFDSNFFNCNMETQTDMMFDTDLFNTDDYSNMYTQTCNEIFGGLTGFNDNQTQTVQDETLRSVESQTSMSSLEKLAPRYFSHSETQTDVEFKKMLEIINS